METDGHLTRDEIERHYAALGPRLLLYLERRTGDPALAGDLLQDVFLGLLASPIRSGADAEIKSYLYRAAYSRLVDHARRSRRDRGRRAWLSMEPVSASAADGTDVERAFRNLPARDASLLWLAYVEEMTHNEIAEVMAVKTASVKVLLHRARKRMRAAMIAGGLAPEGAR